MLPPLAVIQLQCQKRDKKNPADLPWYLSALPLPRVELWNLHGNEISGYFPPLAFSVKEEA